MLEELKNNITKAKWEEKTKQRMLKLLPYLKENFTKFLVNESYRLGFDFSGESLTEAAEAISSATQQISSGKAEKAIEILNTAPDNAWWENGQYILPWALDLEQLLKTGKVVNSSELQIALDNFKVKMFSSLPSSSVIDVLATSVVRFLKRSFNLHLLLKEYIYKKHWENDPKIVRPFVDSLLTNKELIDSKNTLADLFKDFFASSPGLPSQKSYYDITKYMVSGKIAKNLNEKDKQNLAEFLKMYVWLLQPSVEPEEIGLEDYSKKRRPSFINTQRAEIPSQLTKSAPFIPEPKNAPAMKSMLEIRPNLEESQPEITATPLSQEARNIQEQIKKNQTYSKYFPNLENRLNKQEEIDGRLEDLRKKVKN